MTLAEITAAIEAAWQTTAIKTDWLGLEAVLRATVDNPTANDARKVNLVREAVAAFTRRG
jgi:hypothetical protein